jgi:hypothetical protein
MTRTGEREQVACMRVSNNALVKNTFFQKAGLGHTNVESARILQYVAGLVDVGSIVGLRAGSIATHKNPPLPRPECD